MEVLSSVEAARTSPEITAYIAAKNGTFLFSEFGCKDGPIHFDIVKTTYPTGLDKVNEGIKVHNYKPIPLTLMSRIIAIFRRVYREIASEFVVMLDWDNEKGTYSISRPKFQTVGPAYLKYEQNHAIVGNIHSHCNMSAFYSGIDDDYEKTQPGIYMVVGHISSKRPSLVASLTGCDERYHLTVPEIPDCYLDYEINDEEFSWWMETCQTLADVAAKTTGFFLLDSSGDVLCWRETVEEFDGFVGREGNVVVSKDDLISTQNRLKAKSSAARSSVSATIEAERKEVYYNREPEKRIEIPKERKEKKKEKKGLSPGELKSAAEYIFKVFSREPDGLKEMFRNVLFSMADDTEGVVLTAEHLRTALAYAEKQVVTDLEELAAKTPSAFTDEDNAEDTTPTCPYCTAWMYEEDGANHTFRCHTCQEIVTMDGDIMKIACPGCGEDTDIDDGTCELCGAPLFEEDEDTRDIPIEPMDPDKVAGSCSSCGCIITNGDIEDGGCPVCTGKGAVCVWCEGQGCDRCEGAGWLPSKVRIAT